MKGVDKQPHIRLSKHDVHPVCLAVGDPARAQKIASMCQTSKALEYNREYRSFSCTHNGQKFLVISHGVGSSGAAICFEELYELGVQVIIRAGTAGSLKVKEIRQGDVVICYAAAKEDGVSLMLEPHGMPAVADIDVFLSLAASAKELSIDAKKGITVASDLFYAPKAMPSTLGTWRDCGAHVVEMEAAALFVLARQKDRRAGCIVAIDGSPFAWEAGDYDPHGAVVDSGKDNMIKIAIGACVKLSKEYDSGSKEN